MERPPVTPVNDYDFVIGDVISEGWRRVHGFKATVWGGLVIYAVISIILALVCKFFGWLALSSSAQAAKMVTAISSWIAALIKAPLGAGLAMMGVKRAVDHPVEAKLVLHYYKNFWRIIGVLIASIVIICIFAIASAVLFNLGNDPEVSSGMQLLCKAVGVIAGLIAIYFTICYKFVIPLTLDKNLGIWASLEASRRGVTKHWFKVFFTLIAMFIILALSALLFLIGLIWTLPLAFAVYGVLYRTIFGVTTA